MGDNDCCKEASEHFSKQLHLELESFYLYQACYAHCDSSKMCAKGLKKFFKSQYKEELKHAQGIIEYMNLRDYKIEFYPITPPKKLNDILCPLELLKMALENELNESSHINMIYKKASEHDDYATCQFLDAYVNEQLHSIKELKDLITNYERASKDMAAAFLDCKLNKCCKK